MSRGLSGPRERPAAAIWAVVIIVAAIVISILANWRTPATDALPDGVPDTAQAAVVDRVVDGDTVRVLTDAGEELTVRLIGVDTPETVDPGEPVQCYGPEASAFTAQTLPEDSNVFLERDPSQGDVDRYGRTLAYLWHVDTLDGAQLLNYELVAGGYAREYTYDTDYRYQRQLRTAQDTARSARAGLWGVC
ncbi:thermonuclease family protein [Rathayibacter sp. Leaf299]|uniref:thermonuclease family protein n=1 Tax=Rathayibacter sp. Leaf299 TaxID=1736328 RepID=UPI000A5FD6CE|nr:thermonuclease family protein [Rathayibacter sp. Leaf299]